jgi:hypothetical protein
VRRQSRGKARLRGVGERRGSSIAGIMGDLRWAETDQLVHLPRSAHGQPEPLANSQHPMQAMLTW